ncbi:MAG: transglutaminase domain-containing protein, partial [Pseudomonadota bacterium]
GWQRENPEPRAIAQQALAHFRNENFVYTLKPPLLGQDPVDEFLFATRRGFCEHYAAAFVTLMRAAGIPARIVNGYQGGEVNTAGNYLVVRNSDAHAWAEIWVPNDGWVRVDPTSAIAPERVELGIDALRRLEARGVAPGSLPAAAVLRAIELGWFEGVWRHAGWYWDIANFNWHRWVVGYGKARQERFLKNFGMQNISWEKLLALLVGGSALVLLAYVAWQWRPPRMRDPVQRQYLRFCHKLARIGLVRAPHEGALDFAHRCLTKRADLQPAIEDITAKYLRLRYDRAANEDEWRAFKREVAAFRP